MGGAPCSHCLSSIASQAGNKSFLPNRQDVGIIGYTGYNPSWGAVPVPIKVIQPRVGRPASQGHTETALLAPRNAHQMSQKQCAYAAEPGDYAKERTKTLFMEQSKAPVAGATFLASSTKRDQIDNSANTVRNQLQKTDNVKVTTVMYEAGRQQRRTAPVPPRSMPNPDATPVEVAEQLTHAELTDGGTIELQTGYKAGYNTTMDRSNTFQLMQEERDLPATHPHLRNQVRPVFRRLEYCSLFVWRGSRFATAWHSDETLTSYP